MGNVYTGRHKDDENEGDLFYSSIKCHKLTNQDAINILKSTPLNLVKSAKPGRQLFFRFIQPETRDYWLHELFLKHYPGKGITIPKHLVSLDEKCLRQCVELLHMNASGGVPCALSGNMNFELMSDSVEDQGRNSLDETKYAIDYPVEVERDLVKNSADEEIVGSIMGSDSMMNILSSSLFQRLGISANDARLKGTSLLGNKSCVLSDYQDFACHSTYSPQKPEKEPLALRGPDFSSESSGMLRCAWKDGIPHFTFSVDDQKELYVANAWKLDIVQDDKSLDYVYSFHLKPIDQKMHYDNWSEVVGKMKVSTSISPCANNSKIMMTEFVLVIPSEAHGREMRTLSKNSRQSRKLSKVIEVLKNGPSSKQQASSVISGTTEQSNNCRPCFSDSDFLPNFEMAAIVVKDHLQARVSQKEGGAGWGLKFLENGQVKQKGVSSNCCKSSESSHNAPNCSTSMDIIVPAGPHGGPRTRDGGPASLLERWRLGGQCDCGGWDIGCPLIVLKAKPREEENKSSSEAHCKSFDLLMEGSKQETPSVKMAKIHDNLYFISFKSSSLSALQCFSIAVAVFHSQSPTLRPKRVHD